MEKKDKGYNILNKSRKNLKISLKWTEKQQQHHYSNGEIKNPREKGRNASVCEREKEIERKRQLVTGWDLEDIIHFNLKKSD